MSPIALMLILSLSATIAIYLASRSMAQRQMAPQPVAIRPAKSHRR